MRWYDIAKMKEDLIEEAIKNGHEIADKIRSASTVEEVDALDDEIEKYSDFVDENFGVYDDIGEKNCELSMMLFMAAEEKARYLEYHQDKPQKIGDESVKDFEEMLDSQEWANSPHGVSLDSKNAE